MANTLSGSFLNVSLWTTSRSVQGIMCGAEYKNGEECMQSKHLNPSTISSAFSSLVNSVLRSFQNYSSSWNSFKPAVLCQLNMMSILTSCESLKEKTEVLFITIVYVNKY